jgi:hypothetical protein
MIQKIEFYYEKPPPRTGRLLPMSGTVSKEGMFTFKVADSAKISEQSCKVKSLEAKVEIKMNDPKCIHVDEFLHMKLDYIIEDEMVQESGKIIIQCNKGKRDVNVKLRFFGSLNIFSH